LDDFLSGSGGRTVSSGMGHSRSHHNLAVLTASILLRISGAMVLAGVAAACGQDRSPIHPSAPSQVDREGSAPSEQVVLTAVDSGWYASDGHTNPAFPGGDQYPAGCCWDGNELRNFFVFDLSTVTGRTITSATLGVYNELFFTRSADGMETLTLFDVSTSLAALVGRFGGITAFADLGSGITYGSRSFSDLDNKMVVDISLNASALTALNSATGLLAIGGAVTTLNSDLSEAIFSFSNGAHRKELVLTLSP
jgi:hypothetical protein